MKINRIKFKNISLSYPFSKLFKLRIQKKQNKKYNSESKELNLFNNNISIIKKVNDKSNNKKEIKSERKNYLLKDRTINNKKFFCKKLSIKNNSTINIFKKNYNIFGDCHLNQRITIENFNINKNNSRNKKSENNKINSNDVFENYNIKNIDFPDIIKHKKEYKSHFYKFKNKNEFLKTNNDRFKKYDLIMNNLRLKFHGNILFNKKLKDIISKDKNLFRKQNSSFINIEKEFDSYSKEVDDKFSSFTIKQKCNFTNELIKNSLSERKHELF